MTRLTLLGAVAALAALALSIHLVTAGGSSPRSGRLAVTKTHAPLAGTTLRGHRLSGYGVLGTAAGAPLLGSFGALAVPSKNRSELAYNTWRWLRSIDWTQSLGAQGVHTGDPLGTPTLRVRDLQSGNEIELEPGTFSASWRADGALGYVRGREPEYRANTPYLRDLLVRRAPDASATVWSSSPGRYVVVGWAKRDLLVADQLPGGGADLLVFTGPQDEQTLARNADPLAISPDGSAVLVADSPADAIAPAIRLVAISDAHELARIPLATITDPVTSAPITWISGPAHWTGDHVVASTSSGLVVLRASATAASVEQVLHVDAATRPNGMLYEPRFGGSDARTIIAWSDVAYGSQAAQLVCDRSALTCVEGARVPTSAPPRPVYDRSGGDQ